MFAIRGAVRIDRNDRDSIAEGTRALLGEILARNELDPSRIVAAHFTMTPDLDAAFPAATAREMGWTDVPMLGAQETAVPGAPDRMLRVLLFIRGEGEALPVYLGEAAELRPDLPGADPDGADADDADADEPRAGGETGGLGTLLVVGLGLIGGSAALAFRSSGLFETILGTDVRGTAVEAAEVAGVIDRGDIDPVPLLREADVALLTIPVDAIPSWLRHRGRSMRPGMLVMDAGSTKTAVIRAMDELSETVRAVGGHPMAGSERSGLEHATAGLFRGATWALVESRRTGDTTRATAEAMVRAVGARPVWIDAASHDRGVAATSHLPYLAASTLARQLEDGDPTTESRLWGPGARDMTRLARTDPRMMAGVLATNWPDVRSEMLTLEVGLRKLRLRLDAAAGTDRSLVERVERTEETLRALIS
ncbi:MAG TPA: chorismate mutase [Gemmatimonadota bacterium]|nr:chorismate mutase [Gemmatimonadota bacterium]